MSFLRRWSISTRRPYDGVLIALVVSAVVLTFASDSFLSTGNLGNIVRANTVLLILAVGATLVIIGGGIDLSVATSMIASVMIFGLAVDAGWPLVVSIAVTLAFGLFLGAVNGVLVGPVGLSPFVATLGTLSVFQSFSLVINDGQTISLFTEESLNPVIDLVNGEVWEFPALLIVWALAAGGAAFALRYTPWGRRVFSLGSNREAARLAGISVVWISASTYIVAGGLGALAAVLQVGRLSGAAPQIDPNLLLAALAAVLLGGNSFQGGEGSIFGTVLGVAFLGVVQNGLTLLSISSFWQGTVTGTILIAAVAAGNVRLKSRAPVVLDTAEAEADPSADRTPALPADVPPEDSGRSDINGAEAGGDDEVAVDPTQDESVTTTTTTSTNRRASS